MTRTIGRAAAAALVVLGAVAVVAAAAPPRPADAAVVAPFGLVYNAEVYGDFLVTGNAVVACPTGSSTCASAAARTTSGVNDDHAMTYVNADPTVSTLNSSTSRVTIPPGATVRHARLTWAGNTGVRGGSTGSRCTATAATSTPSGSPSTQTVRLRVAGGSVLSLPPAAYSFTAEPAPASGIVQYYSADAEVTTAFASAPSGTPFDVTVGGIWTPQGQNCFGGWSLYLVWGFDGAEPTYAPLKREIFLFDGHIRQAQTDPATPASITGFRVAGGGANRVGLTAYEGDWGITGDRLAINGSDIVEPHTGGTASNFFVSDADGAADPALANNFSVDAKSFEVPPEIIGPGDTSATMTFSTSGDSYLAQAVALSVPIPNVQVTKTAEVATARPGDEVEFTITVRNPTDIPAVGVVATDAQAPACDRTIGDVAARTTTSYTCTATVPDVDTYVNGVRVEATNQFGDELVDEAESEPVDVYDGSIALAKEAVTPDVAPGGTVTWRITVTNTAEVPLDDVVVSDPLAPDCARTVGDLAVGAAPVTYTCTSTAGGEGFSNTATVTATDVHGRTTTASASDGVTVTAPATGAPDREEARQGAPVAFTPAEGDTPSTGAALVPSTLVLVDPDTGDEVSELVVPGEGTWTVEGDGTATFTPRPAFTGDTTPVTYRIEDDAGQVASSTLTATLTPVVPSAVADDATTTYDDPVVVDVLANDEPGHPDVPLDPGTVTLLDAGGDPVTDLEVPGEGRWTSGSGELVFAPDGSSGATTPVTYRVADENGTTATAPVVVTVGAGPTADLDTGTVRQGGTITVDALHGDTPSDGATLDPATLQLFDAAAGAWRTTVIVPDEGTWSVVDGEVRLVAEPAFRGVASVVYRSTDTGGDVASSAVAVTVTPVDPVGVDDEAAGPYGQDLTLDVVGNDEPGHPDVPLVVQTLRLLDPGTGEPATELVVPGEGTWALAGGGSVRLSPVPGFTGPATPVTYRVADANGTTTTATISVAVGSAPVARPDGTTTPQDVTATLDPTADDSPGGGATIVASSVEIRRGSGAWGTSLVVPGEGTWAVAGDGTVDFDPEPGFVGPASVVEYRFADSHDSTASSTLSVTVTPITPTAGDDAATTPYATPVTVDVLADDEAGHPSAPLDPASVRLVDPAAGALVAELEVADEGTWAVASGGRLTFAPADGFEGPATPVTYEVRDANGTPARAEVVVTVGAAPVAGPDSGTTAQGQPATVDLVDDDVPGTGATFELDGLQLRDPATSAWDDAVTVAGEGTWTATDDGRVTFTPLPSFTGTTTPVTYRVVDTNGSAATATVTVTVTPITPVAADDAATTPHATPVTVAVLDNDVPGDASAPLDPTSVALVDPLTGDPVTTLEVDGEGTWTAADDGTITFAPEAGVSGAAGPVAYEVADANGTRAAAELAVAVGAAPVARPDTATTRQDVSVDVEPLANDDPGTDATVVAGSVDLDDEGTWAGEVTVDGEGTWTVADDVVAFDPVPGFTGTTTPLRYRFADSDGNRAASTIAVTVTPVVPSVLADSASTPNGRPATVDVLANDDPGDPSAPLDPSTLALVDPGTGDRVATVVVPGEGTWEVGGGSLTFTPEPGFEGPTTPVTYEVADENGTTGRAPVVVTVDAPPEAAPDSGTTDQGVPVTVAVLGNDAPGPRASLVPGSLALFDAAAGTWGTSAAVAGQGTWTVEDGEVRLAPEPTFTGVASVAYRVADTDGNQAAATVSVTVVPVVPDAVDDEASTPATTPVTVDVLDNDAPGAGSAPLDPASVRLVDPATGDPVTELVVADEGSWTVVAGGRVAFAPDGGFSGPATPVTYRVADENGTTATASVRVAVGAMPVAHPDTTTTRQGVAISVAPAEDDVPGDGATLVAGSVQLDAGGTWADEVTVAGEGRWTVAGDEVTFDPDPTFTGEATIGYRVADSDGNRARSTVTVTVTAVVPSADDDEATTPHGRPVSVDVLDGDVAGHESAPLVPASVRLVDPSSGDLVATVAVDGEGTWTAEADGTATFAPADGFAGRTTPVAYSVADDNGTRTTGRVTVTVGDAPIARPDVRTTPQDTDVALAPGSDDTPGTGAEIDPATVDLARADGPWELEVTIDGEGAWSVDGDGTVTFDPEPGFVGTTTAVRYRIADTDGNRAASTITVEVTPVVPVATDDAARTPQGRPVTIAVLDNDVEGASNAPLVASSVRLLDGGDPVTTLTVAGEGTWAVDDGEVTFTPAASFTGVTTPVTYRVADDNGTTAEAEVVVTTGAAPTAAPDATTTPQGAAVTLDPLANDQPGEGAELDPATVELHDGGRGTWGTQVAVADEGTWVVGPEGSVTFTPELSFTGVASVPYRVADTDGLEAASTLAVTIVPFSPVAVDDEATTPSATPVLVDVLANDEAGAASAPLDPATLTLVDPASGADAAAVTVEGQGAFAVDAGRVAFDPRAGFAGRTVAVTYRVADLNGTATTAEVVVTVGAGPTARPDDAATPPGTPVTLAVLVNDSPSEGATWAPETLCVVAPGDGCATEVVVAGEGSWTVGDGAVTFVPEPAYRGAAEIPYEVADALGNRTWSLARVVVAPGDGADGGAQEPPVPEPEPGPGPSGPLSVTGAIALGLLSLLGLGLVLAGTAMTAGARRKRLVPGR